MPEYDDTDGIHDYLEGDMDKTALEAFEELVNNDPQLKQEVEWHKNFKDAVFVAEKEELAQRVKELIAVEKEQGSKDNSVVSLPKPSNQKRFYWIAAAAVLLLTFGLGLLFMPNNENSLLVNELQKTYAAPVVTMGENEPNSDQIWQESISAYQLKDYKKVVLLLSQKEQHSSLDSEQKFYLGLAHLYQEKGQTQKAIQYFATAKKENPMLYEENSNWYIALAYLKVDDKEAAKEYLQQIVSTKSWKHQEAQELLEEL
ncbi:MAG: tol-pal system YbgF family protein [Chitinophagales bacterium]